MKKLGIPHVSYPLSGWKPYSNGTLYMYTGDIRTAQNNNEIYSDDFYEWTISHEMGHVFGLDDGYGEDNLTFWDKINKRENRPDAGEIIGENDVMKYQYNGVNISSIDIQMLLLAYTERQPQYYFSYNGNQQSKGVK